MSDLIFPAKVLDQHLVVLGKTGAGKSSALRHVVEHLLRKKKRLVIVDPKGDWWGLKVSADGKSEGFPVITFGNFKGDVKADIPINEQSGKHLAELVSTGNRPCVIGLGGWMTSHLVKFWIGFASTLFKQNSGELYLIGDEFHNFAPKGKILDIDAGKCLHWSNRLLNEGRGLGLVCLIASQRPQKVHNDTLTACETLVAMRVIHKADREAVKDWIEGCGDMDRGKEILNSLAGMKRGEAYVWSPEIEFGPKLVTFPMFETFDSFAPPQLQKKVVASDWSNVDLEDVKQKLASVIEEAKQNDPAELKAEIARLRAEARSVQHAKPTPAPAEPKTIEVPILDKTALKAIETVSGNFNTARENLEGATAALRDAGERMGELFAEVTKLSSSRLPPRPPLRELHAGRSASVARSSPVPLNRDIRNGEVSGGLRRMMIALAQRPGLNKRQLGVRAGLSSSSGTFGTYLGKLRSNGWIEESNNQFSLTQAGIDALGSYEPLPEGEALYRYWLNHLGNSGAARILQTLFEAYPQALSKEDLGDRAVMSHTSGTFGTYLGKLRTLELVEGRSEISATKEFFE